MFCYQCEQTAKGTGCDAFGVCGKDPKTAALQDLLLYLTKGVSMYAHRAVVLGAQDAAVDKFVIDEARKEHRKYTGHDWVNNTE